MNVYLEFFNLNIQLSLFLQEMLTPDKIFCGVGLEINVSHAVVVVLLVDISCASRSVLSSLS